MLVSIFEQVSHFECAQAFFSFNRVSSFQTVLSMLCEPGTRGAFWKCSFTLAHLSFHDALLICVIRPG